MTDLFLALTRLCESSELLIFEWKYAGSEVTYKAPERTYQPFAGAGLPSRGMKIGRGSMIRAKI